MSDSAADLIKRAFYMARDSGKDDWGRMTIAVLKNRLLQLTHGQFNEAQYGAKSFGDFVRQAGDILTLDTSTSPPVVTLTSEQAAFRSAPKPSPAAGRVRPDLWRAVVDYSSERVYVWNMEQQEVQEADPDSGLPRLPTVNPQELSEWRAAFVEKHQTGLDSDSREKLLRWQQEGLPTGLLPPSLRGVWNSELKTRVSDRLHQWFATQEFPSPGDIIEPTATTREAEDSAALRKVVIDCVKVMTSAELAELRLSPAAVLRMLTKIKSDA